MNKVKLSSLTEEELKDYLVSLGEKAYRGGQVFSFINKNQVEKIEDITVLSKETRKNLAEKAYIEGVKVYKKLDSQVDATRKYLFQLDDGNIIEGVAMDYAHGTSICISTQVGCRMGCEFCASTKDGLVRDLTPGEMLGQVYSIEKDIGVEISNIVLMGSGEPLDNYDNVMTFLEIIHSKNGKNLSYRNITLSTCGIVPKIYDLAEENLAITLSISLHSPFDSKRKEIMPIARKYTVKELIDACKHYLKVNGRRVTIEYTLISGVNDGDEEAYELKKLLGNDNFHINLIPLNPIEEYSGEKPEDESVKKFKKKLEELKIRTTIRREMGSDINASCGQLRRRYTK